VKFSKEQREGKCRVKGCTHDTDGAIPITTALYGKTYVCVSHFPEAYEWLLTYGSAPAEPLPPLHDEVEKAKALTAALDTFVIDTQDDYAQAAEILHVAIDDHEAYENARKADTGPLHKAWLSACSRYSAGQDVMKGLVARAKDLILQKRLAEERAVDEAIAAGLPVPALLEPPPGVSFPKPEVSIKVLDLSEVPEDYLCLAVDLDKVASSGKNKIPGLEITYTRSVTFRRPTKEKEQ